MSGERPTRGRQSFSSPEMDPQRRQIRRSERYGPWQADAGLLGRGIHGQDPRKNGDVSPGFQEHALDGVGNPSRRLLQQQAARRVHGHARHLPPASIPLRARCREAAQLTVACLCPSGGHWLRRPQPMAGCSGKRVRRGSLFQTGRFLRERSLSGAVAATKGLLPGALEVVMAGADDGGCLVGLKLAVVARDASATGRPDRTRSPRAVRRRRWSAITGVGT